MELADGPRARFEANLSGLRDRTVVAVDYWDVHDFSGDPSVWDHGDWHHAVMGVQLTTDRGPVTVTWTNTFHSYGVEAFHDPIDRHLVLAEEGPQRVGPDTGRESHWTPRLGSPIRGASYLWTRLEVGPGRLADGTVVSPARHEEIPAALRIDFDAGPVWFVAAIPQWPDLRRVVVPGDALMVVFSGQKMYDMGFDDT